MTHTPECLNYQKTLAEDRAEWIAKYPSYCRKCEGAGELHDPGNRDEPPSVDDCECLESFRCPRCGAAVEPRDFADSRIMVACLACGWSEKTANTDPDHQCPPAFDGCGCAENDTLADYLYMRDSFHLLTSKEYHDLALGSFPPEDDPECPPPAA